MIEIDIRLPLADFVIELRTSLGARVTAVVGPSGSGKTSLLEVIAGIRKGATGRLAIDGDVLLDTTGNINVAPERRSIGYVPQDVALFPHLSVRRNITFARSDDRRLAELCALLELTPLVERMPASLSGGEKQRVALARALMSSPRLLLLDEPLAAVDQPLRERIVGYLRRIRDTQSTPMLYVTHHPFEALALCEEALVLRDGALVAQGPAERILHDPDVAGSGALENVLEVDEPRHDAAKGITRVTTREGLEIVLAYDQVATAQFPLIVRISGEDIVVFTREPQAISSRNVIRGTVERLRLGDGVADLVIATPAHFHVRVTLDAADDLQLAEGSAVWLALRSRAFRIVG